MFDFSGIDDTLLRRARDIFQGLVTSELDASSEAGIFAALFPSYFEECRFLISNEMIAALAEAGLGARRAGSKLRVAGARRLLIDIDEHGVALGFSAVEPVGRVGSGAGQTIANIVKFSKDTLTIALRNHGLGAPSAIASSSRDSLKSMVSNDWAVAAAVIRRDKSAVIAGPYRIPATWIQETHDLVELLAWKLEQIIL